MVTSFVIKRMIPDCRPFSHGFLSANSKHILERTLARFCSNETAPMASGEPYLKQKKVKFYLKICHRRVNMLLVCLENFLSEKTMLAF